MLAKELAGNPAELSVSDLKRKDVKFSSMRKENSQRRRFRWDMSVNMQCPSGRCPQSVALDRPSNPWKN